jgi:hypothetical protein
VARSTSWGTGSKRTPTRGLSAVPNCESASKRAPTIALRAHVGVEDRPVVLHERRDAHALSVLHEPLGLEELRELLVAECEMVIAHDLIELELELPEVLAVVLHVVERLAAALIVQELLAEERVARARGEARAAVCVVAQAERGLELLAELHAIEDGPRRVLVDAREAAHDIVGARVDGHVVDLEAPARAELPLITRALPDVVNASPRRKASDTW